MQLYVPESVFCSENKVDFNNRLALLDATLNIHAIDDVSCLKYVGSGTLPFNRIHSLRSFNQVCSYLGPGLNTYLMKCETLPDGFAHAAGVYNRAIDFHAKKLLSFLLFY